MPHELSRCFLVSYRFRVLPRAVCRRYVGKCSGGNRVTYVAANYTWIPERRSGAEDVLDEPLESLKVKRGAKAEDSADLLQAQGCDNLAKNGAMQA